MNFLNNNNTDINHVIELFNTLQEEILTCIIMVVVLIIMKFKKVVNNVMTNIQTRRNSITSSNEVEFKNNQSEIINIYFIIYLLGFILNFHD